MKKYFAVFLEAAGAVGIIAAAVVLGHALYLAITQGMVRSTTAGMLISAAAAALSLPLILGGRKLRQPEAAAGSFAQRELAQSAAPRVRVPDCGPFVWKYRESCGTGLAGSLALLAAGVAAVLLADVAVSIFLTKRFGSSQGILWICTGLIFAAAGLIAWMAMRTGQRFNSRQLAVARDAAGTLYLLDSRSPAFWKYGKDSLAPRGAVSYFIAAIRTEKKLRRIEEARVVETALETGAIAQYGREILAVKSISVSAGACRVYCTLRLANGAVQNTHFVLSGNFQNLDSLRKNLERLRIN